MTRSKKSARKPASARSPGHYRIVLTGGPGGGKTTAADLFRREIGERVTLVPEAATLLFSGGFPRTSSPGAAVATQQAIFHVQRNLEDLHTALYPGRMLLCDRGTVDGAAYWPDDAGDFFTMQQTTLEAELARYDAVLFFETAAAGSLSLEGGNPWRKENTAEALALDHRLRSLWQKHPHFVFVPHNASFFKKITSGLAALESIVAGLCEKGTRPE